VIFSVQHNNEDMEFLCKIIYETIHLPVLYMNKDQEILTSFPTTYLPNPLYPGISELYELLDSFHDPLNIPVLRTTNFLENFLTIKIGTNQELNGMLILGPSLYTVIEDKTIEGLICDLKMKTGKDAVKNYYHSLPVINKIALLHSGILAVYLLYSKKISITDIIQKSEIVDLEDMKNVNSDILLSKSRQETSYHASYEREREMFECIKEGRKADLLKKLTISDRDGKIGVLSKKSHLRSEKNLVIACITLATRYAIEGGLQQEIAYTMSDLYIQSVEDIDTVTRVNTFLEHALYDFADRVEKVKHYRYSKPINECLSYIFKHLYEEITLVHLSKITNMHQNYLSARFKKEVGISFSEYVLKQKIEEAKKLLSYSDHTISEIYSWLNFHDQGHFTKVFKKYTGTTPKKYRLNGK